ncbi:uncharacterized protein LOC144509344 isoform X2 [Mustelus asterias]
MEKLRLARESGIEDQSESGIQALSVSWIKDQSWIRSESGIEDQSWIRSESGIEDQSWIRSESGIEDQSWIQSESGIEDQSWIQSESGIEDQSWIQMKILSQQIQSKYRALRATMHGSEMENQSGIRAQIWFDSRMRCRTEILIQKMETQYRTLRAMMRGSEREDQSRIRARTERWIRSRIEALETQYRTLRETVHERGSEREDQSRIRARTERWIRSRIEALETQYRTLRETVHERGREMEDQSGIRARTERRIRSRIEAMETQYRTLRETVHKRGREMEDQSGIRAQTESQIRSRIEILIEAMEIKYWTLRETVHERGSKRDRWTGAWPSPTDTDISHPPIVHHKNLKAAASRTQQNQLIVLQQELFIFLMRSSYLLVLVNIEDLVLELQPGILLYPTICTKADCWKNRTWLYELQHYCKSMDCSAGHRQEDLIHVVKAVIRAHSSFIGSYVLSSSWSDIGELYNLLLEQEPERGKMLQESVAATEDLDRTKMDLEILAMLLSVYPPWKSLTFRMGNEAPSQRYPHFTNKLRNLTTLSMFSYTTAVRIAQSTNVWYKREFLHAVLLSMKTKQDQIEMFYNFRGDEILLPSSIDSMWVKTVKSMRFLLQKHVFSQVKLLHGVMWFGPNMIKELLNNLALYGFQHISRELEKCMNGRSVIQFRDEKPLGKKMYTKIDGGCNVDAADTATESCPPKIQLHTKHLLSNDDIYQYDLSFTFNVAICSEPWLFRMAGALASEWRAVASDLRFSYADIEKTALDPWYNHQHRMFHFLKRFMGERDWRVGASNLNFSDSLDLWYKHQQQKIYFLKRLKGKQTVKFTELCFLLLCKGKEYKCYSYLQDIIGTALRDVNYSEALSFQYINQLNVGETETLAAFYKKGHSCPVIKETSGKEFEKFRKVVSLLGPAYDVYTPAERPEVFLYLPSDAPAEESVSASFLEESFHALSAVMSPDHFATELCNFIPQQKQEMYKFLVSGEYDSLEDLMCTDTAVKAKMFNWVKTNSSIVRTWPQMYRHLLELFPVRVGHIKDENLELFVPLAVTETHAVVFVNSCSPFVTLEKFFRNVTSYKAYFLLYKPVGRSYVDFSLTLKVMLVPRSRSLLQELDKTLKDHKQVLKKQVGVHRNSWYKLQVRHVNAAGTSLSISPEEAEQFQFADSAEEPLTEYEIKIDMGKWETWPLVLELVENEKNIKIQTTLQKGMLNAENRVFN